MERTKENKAITLVALVITIIILLILAGIAISQLTNNGLFNNTQVAKQEYANSQEREDDILKQYENAIQGDYVTNNSREIDETTINAKLTELERKINLLTPVELYSNTSGANGNFTLSQSINNFTTIEIIYTESSSTNGSANFYMKATPAELNSGVTLNAFSAAGNNTYIQIFSCGLTINGTTATRATTTYAYNAGNSTSLYTVNGNGNISVTKVIGYKY